MQQNIIITRDNVNNMAKGLAASVNYLGFRKNGKEMVASQAVLLLAKLKGLNEHTLMQALEQPDEVEPTVDRGAHALSLLRGLVRYLTRNYGDDLWDGCTREFLEEAAALTGMEPFVWELDDEDLDDEAGPQAIAACEAHGVSLVEAQEDEIRGMWDWLDGNGNACEHSFDTIEAAALNAVAVLHLTPMAPETAADVAPYTKRSFELGALSRDSLLAVLEEGDYPAHVYDWPADDIRSVILEAEFPGSTDPAPTRSE